MEQKLIFKDEQAINATIAEVQQAETVLNEFCQKWQEMEIPQVPTIEEMQSMVRIFSATIRTVYEPHTENINRIIGERIEAEIEALKKKMGAGANILQLTKPKAPDSMPLVDILLKLPDSQKGAFWRVLRADNGKVTQTPGQMQKELSEHECYTANEKENERYELALSLCHALNEVAKVEKNNGLMFGINFNLVRLTEKGFVPAIPFVRFGEVVHNGTYYSPDPIKPQSEPIKKDWSKILNS